MITVLIETTIDLSIEAELLVRIHDRSDNDGQISSRKMPVYLSIFALAQWVTSIAGDALSNAVYCSVFQFVMAVDAVYARNTLQFICLT